VEFSVPLKILFTVDPNVSSNIISAEMVIENRSNAPLALSILSFTQNEADTVQFENCLVFEQDWENLNRANTLKYIALGLNVINPEDTSWYSLSNSVLYAKEVSTERIGVLKPNSSIGLNIIGKTGRLFTELLEIRYNIVFVFELN
jgi:hypothetical protein